MFRQDPGECPVCGMAHCACTAASGPIAIAQLPMRDALPLPIRPMSSDIDVVNAFATSELGDGSDDRPFSTGTYRGKKKRR